MQVNHSQCWHPQSINMWNSPKYKNAFTWPTDEKGKMMGKIIELFLSSYEFLLRNCNKIYCFIKACWNLFSKSRQQAKPSIFLSHMETTWELKSALSCFAFWENMVGLSNHHLPHVFCCSLCALSCSICVCSEFLQSLFFLLY